MKLRKVPVDGDKEGGTGAGVPTPMHPPAKEVDALQLAIVLAYRDALSLDPGERVFYRYVWWPKGWPHMHLLTRAQQSLLSNQGDFPNPVPIGPRSAGVFRLDFRESGWDRRFQVWERFAAIDFIMHNKWRFLKDTAVTVYFPPGIYDGKFHDASYEIVRKKAGDEIFRPAVWANPAVEIGPGVTVLAQDELRKLLSTEAPILGGPFWMVRTARVLDLTNDDLKVGYYEWLGIKNRNDYFKLIGLDEKRAIEAFAEWRAVQQKSGISKQSRQIVLLRGATGLVWGTLDVKKQKGRGVAIKALRRGEFDHDAEEWISHLPNGLPANALFIAKDNDALKVKAGDAQATAPDFIGGDKSALNPTNDLRIHNGQSCWNCHGVSRDYIFPFEDWVRKQFKASPDGKPLVILRDPDRKVDLELRSNYFRDIYELANDDRMYYTRAVRALTRTNKPGDVGLTVAGFARIYAGGMYQYIHDGVSLETAANELGVEKDVFRQGLIRYNAGRGSSDLVLGEYLSDPPGEVERLDFEDAFAIAQIIARGYRVPEIVTRVKALP